MDSSFESANKKMVLEKIEILDESTGQIILKERVVFAKPAEEEEEEAEVDDSSPAAKKLKSSADDDTQCQIAFVRRKARLTTGQSVFLSTSLCPFSRIRPS